MAFCSGLGRGWCVVACGLRLGSCFLAALGLGCWVPGAWVSPSHTLLRDHPRVCEQSYDPDFLEIRSMLPVGGPLNGGTMVALTLLDNRLLLDLGGLSCRFCRAESCERVLASIASARRATLPGPSVLRVMTKAPGGTGETVTPF